MEIQEFISREKARCDGFRLLAACFYQPQAGAFQEERLLANLAGSLNKVCCDASAAAVNMIAASTEYSEEELLVDYAGLFMGPTELLAAPYGSVYLDKEGRVMGDSTMAAVDFYRTHGLVMDEDFTEVPDHIAVELEFMHYLVFKEIEALEASDMETAAAFMKAQELFMNTFIRKWADKFAARIVEGAETAYYKALGECLYSFIYKTDIKEGLPAELKAAAVSQ